MSKYQEALDSVKKEVLEICSSEMGDCGICPYDGTDTCYLMQLEIKESYEDEEVKLNETKSI